MDVLINWMGGIFYNVFAYEIIMVYTLNILYFYWLIIPQ